MISLSSRQNARILSAPAKHRRTALLLCLFLGMIPLGSFGTEQAGTLLLQWYNDLLSGSDRGYTNGTRIAVVREIPTDREAHNLLQRWLYRLGEATELRRFEPTPAATAGRSSRFSWSTGLPQLMYTPDDAKAPVAPPGERPYAGWLGLEASLHVSDRNSTSSATLSVGTTGEHSYAHDMQDWVHQNISSTELFQGWDSQMPSELTINLHFDRKEQPAFLRADRSDLVEVDGYFEWGGALGNFRTNAYLGALLRFGHNLPSTFATPRVQLGSLGHAPFMSGRPQVPDFSLSGFAGVRGTLVGHDITLHGPVFRDFDPGVDPELLVGELVYGLAVRVYALDLSISQTLRSDEFRNQTENQSFGSILLQARYRF